MAADRPAARTRGRGPHPLPLFLALGLRRTQGDPERLAAFLDGLSRYQQAQLPPARPPRPVVARRGQVQLELVGGPADGPLLVAVPSLINAPAVLDLAAGRSLLGHLVDCGFRVLLLDWGPMHAGERRLGLAGLVSARLLPLLAGLGRPVHLLGYCVGGTLAIAAACLMGGRLGTLSLIAAPWHFDGFAPEARRDGVRYWRLVQPVASALGGLPVSLLNPLFWGLDEESVVRKFVALAARSPGDPAVTWFAAVEDWANSGAPLSRAAARDLFEAGYRRDAMGRGRWRVAGQRIDPAAIPVPILDIGAAADRIVPPPARLRRPGIDRLDVPGGHVGMVVGRAAPDAMWKPLSTWLASR